MHSGLRLYFGHFLKPRTLFGIRIEEKCGKTDRSKDIICNEGVGMYNIIIKENP